MSKRSMMFLASDMDAVLDHLINVASAFENPVAAENWFTELLRARVRRDFDCSRCGEQRRGYSTIVHGEGRVCVVCIPEPVEARTGQRPVPRGEKA